jgi:hypothetical protein
LAPIMALAAAARQPSADDGVVDVILFSMA